VNVNELTKKIVGYAGQISAIPGQTIKFMVSCYGVESYEAELVRLIHGDVNPAGPGFKSEPVVAVPSKTLQGREQKVYSGSYALVPADPRLDPEAGVTLQAMVWPTTPEKGRQALIGRVSADGTRGYQLMLDEIGALALLLGDGSGEPTVISTGTPLLSRHWYFVGATFDAASGEVRLYQEPLFERGSASLRAEVIESVSLGSIAAGNVPLLIAGQYTAVAGGRVAGVALYNGKIDRPRVAGRAFSRLEMSALAEAAVPEWIEAGVLAAWDLSVGIPTNTITDVSHNHLDGTLVNLPARAMKGFNWTGEEMNWQHRPGEYGAIHFHDDDLYDCGWEPDVEIALPESLRSGVYALRLSADEAEDYIPFFVRPGPGSERSDILFVAPTASYLAYANEHMPTNAPLAQLLTDQVAVLQPEDLFLAEHREFGSSTYDVHSDGSGVAYSSRLRPILNMRPKYSSWLGGSGSSLWQFNADTHIVDWLEARGHRYDVITDEDLHRDGVDALTPYRVVLTGTHPEYTSKQMRDAYEAYQRRGGRFMYLGGNGFYWRISFHHELPGVIEVRKGEGGTRAWAAEPGEYYHATTGEYGGLWRRSGFPPQQLVGAGFSAQGFDVSSYFRRQPGSFDERARFIFEGIGDDELIGDFGLIGGGAAGLELDRYDEMLGSPPHALVLASSEGHTDIYLLVVEEILINYPAVSGTQNPMVRGDLVFFETPSGGAVFSASSIAWCGSLSHNNYDNNVSRLMDNVLRRFADTKPFEMPQVAAQTSNAGGSNGS
jgi:N,N-dimethylformamidase